MRYETQEDRDREIKAIKKFVNLFKGSYKKLGHSDIDFRVFDKDKKIIAYVEVKGKSSNLKNAFPVYVAARKLVKLCDKRLNPVIIWACTDGIVYAKVPDLIERFVGVVEMKLGMMPFMTKSSWLILNIVELSSI